MKKQGLVIKFKVEYETYEKCEVNEFFEKQIEEFANSHGLNFNGSGMNFKTGIRDLSFSTNIR